MSRAETDALAPLRALTEWARERASRIEGGSPVRRAAVVGLVASAIVLVISFPSYDQIFGFDDNWDPLLLQAEEPFEPHEYPPESHAAKLAFRLVPPLVGGLLNLGPVGYVVLQSLAGVALFAAAARLFDRLTGDRAAAALYTVALAGAWAGASAFVEMRGVFDGIAFLFLVLACLARRPPLIALCAFLAAWTDERAAVAAGLVFVFHLVEPAQRRDAWWRGGAVVVGLALYVASRLALAAATGLTPAAGLVGLSILVDQIHFAAIGAWTALESLLVVVGLGLLSLWRTRRLAAVAFLLALAAVLGGALLVLDVTRSMAYAIPAVFIGVAVLDPRAQRALAPAVAVINVIVPLYYVGILDRIFWIPPLPFQVLRIATGQT